MQYSVWVKSYTKRCPYAAGSDTLAWNITLWESTYLARLRPSGWTPALYPTANQSSTSYNAQACTTVLSILSKFIQWIQFNRGTMTTQGKGAFCAWTQMYVKVNSQVFSSTALHFEKGSLSLWTWNSDSAKGSACLPVLGSQVHAAMLIIYRRLWILTALMLAQK